MILIASALLILQIPSIICQSNDVCANMEPICTSSGVQFTALATNTSAPAGNNYSCLSEQPSPAWYYLKIASNSPNHGDLNMSLYAASDIDFIIWGPYSSIDIATSYCGSFNEVVDCSYSGTNSETLEIIDSEPGEIYVLLVTNYADIVQNVSLTSKASSTAFTDCSILSPTTTTEIITTDYDSDTNSEDSLSDKDSDISEDTESNDDSSMDEQSDDSEDSDSDSSEGNAALGNNEADDQSTIRNMGSDKTNAEWFMISAVVFAVVVVALALYFYDKKNKKQYAGVEGEDDNEIDVEAITIKEHDTLMLV